MCVYAKSVLIQKTIASFWFNYHIKFIIANSLFDFIHWYFLRYLCYNHPFFLIIFELFLFLGTTTSTVMSSENNLSSIYLSIDFFFKPDILFSRSFWNLSKNPLFNTIYDPSLSPPTSRRYFTFGLTVPNTYVSLPNLPQYIASQISTLFLKIWCLFIYCSYPLNDDHNFLYQCFAEIKDIIDYDNFIWCSTILMIPKCLVVSFPKCEKFLVASI